MMVLSGTNWSVCSACVRVTPCSYEDRWLAEFTLPGVAATGYRVRGYSSLTRRKRGRSCSFAVLEQELGPEQETSARSRDREIDPAHAGGPKNGAVPAYCGVVRKKTASANY